MLSFVSYNDGERGSRKRGKERAITIKMMGNNNDVYPRLFYETPPFEGLVVPLTSQADQVGFAFAPNLPASTCIHLFSPF